jgi:hypothetical protein
MTPLHHVGVDVRKQDFISGRDSLLWLEEAHKVATVGYGSFILFGNEDAPEAVLLYISADPFFNDEPAAWYVQDRDGNLTQVLAPIPHISFKGKVFPTRTGL